METIRSKAYLKNVHTVCIIFEKYFRKQTHSFQYKFLITKKVPCVHKFRYRVIRSGDTKEDEPTNKPEKGILVRRR